MVNIRHLKEKAGELDQSELNPLEKAIVAFFSQNDISPVMSVLESHSDAEAFEIYRQILGEDQPKATYYIENKELSIENDRLDIFLIGRNIIIDLKDEELEFISELGKDTLNLILKIQDDKIVASAPDKVQFKKHFDQALSKLSSIVKDQPINWNAAPKMMAIAVLGLSLSACSKAVWQEPNGNLTPANPTAPIINPVSNMPNVSEIVIMTFANHADPATSDELYSHFKINEEINLELPQNLANLSYQQRPQMPTLNVFVNNTYVCSYVATHGEYQPHSTCILHLELSPGDDIIVKGIPAGETITLKAKSY